MNIFNVITHAKIIYLKKQVIFAFNRKRSIIPPGSIKFT